MSCWLRIYRELRTWESWDATWYFMISISTLSIFCLIFQASHDYVFDRPSKTISIAASAPEASPVATPAASASRSPEKEVVEATALPSAPLEIREDIILLSKDSQFLIQIKWLKSFLFPFIPYKNSETVTEKSEKMSTRLKWFCPWKIVFLNHVLRKTVYFTVKCKNVHEIDAKHKDEIYRNFLCVTNLRG